MNLAPLARIAIRYGVGIIFGTQIGDMLAGDPDVVMYVALGIGAVVEAVYVAAKRKGWAT